MGGRAAAGHIGGKALSHLTGLCSFGCWVSGGSALALGDVASEPFGAALHPRLTSFALRADGPARALGAFMLSRP